MKHTFSEPRPAPLDLQVKRLSRKYGVTQSQARAIALLNYGEPRLG
ncbi:hypothetical protein [Pseudohalocynthiibacter sp. F2068]|jgi:hypothetical protein|nr:hypothetical protein [Pseudohalocynthiibacter sp. F2068]MCK0102350.1 hypothetical protein [Pseudohalocynthiibacter sp. F2068]